MYIYRKRLAKFEKCQKTAAEHIKLSDAMESFVNFLGDEVQGPIKKEEFISIIEKVHNCLIFLLTMLNTLDTIDGSWIFRLDK